MAGLMCSCVARSILVKLTVSCTVLCARVSKGEEGMGHAFNVKCMNA